MNDVFDLIYSHFLIIQLIADNAFNIYGPAIAKTFHRYLYMIHKGLFKK